jgi:hypothetical protein
MRMYERVLPASTADKIGFEKSESVRTKVGHAGPLLCELYGCGRWVDFREVGSHDSGRRIGSWRPVPGGRSDGFVVQDTPGDEPADPWGNPGAADLIVLDHGWRPPGGFLTGSGFDPATAVERCAVQPGTPVRLRLVNTDSAAHRYTVHEDRKLRLRDVS